MRQLQLKRFDIIFKNRDTALSNLKKHEESYVDGEIMAAAYYDYTIDRNGNSQVTTPDIAYIIGVYAKKGDEKKLFTIDVNDIEKQIEDVKYFIKNTLIYASGVELVTASTYSTGTTDNYRVDMENTDQDKFFRLFFTPISSDDDKVSVTIGDIKAGMTAAELKGYTLSRLLDAMLFKTIYPTILNEPSVSITKPSATDVEVGTTISESDFKLTYNKGRAQILMESGNIPTQPWNDTGDETYREINYKFNGGTLTTFNSSLILNQMGNYSFTGTVNYSNGAVLEDSKHGTGDTTGIDVFATTAATKTTKRANPHQSGSVSAATSVATYYKPGANTGTNNSDYSDIVKLNIKGVKGMIIDFKIKENVDVNGKVVAGGAYQIAVPHSIWNGVMGKVMKYNAGANAFNGDDTANWTITPNALRLTDAAGVEYDCDLLEHNVGSIGNDGTGNARVAFQIN